jgi:hypothetical protein
MRLDLQSEKFAATGGMAGEGARRVLGRPQLAPLELMVREALQNSWDARRADVESVLFAIDVWRLTSAQNRVLREQVFAELPSKGLTLSEHLKGDIDVVVISDRGTVGLAGPTRTDEESSDEDPINFIEFFRNVGRLRSGVIGGGTYGFGKASFYAVSQASTIIGYSRIAVGRGRTLSRLMGAALGQQYRETNRSSTRRTGRHWWGETKDGVVEPIQGAAADQLARSLGFREFETGETGTSVMVIAPRIGNGGGEASLVAAARLMCTAAVWYAWPLMLPDSPDRQPRLIVEGSCEGESIQVPDIDGEPLLKEYARTFRHALKARNSNPADPMSKRCMYELRCERPNVLLGRLALSRVFSNVGPILNSGEDEEEQVQAFSVPKGTPAHVALMRGPRLVVRYLPARVPPGVGFVGVFVADDELNGVFAEAEPVTHDDWNSENLEQRRDRTLVRVTRRRIEDQVEDFVRPHGAPDGDASNRPLGAISRLLGGLIPGSLGTGAENQPSRTGSEGGTGTAGSRKVGPRIEMLPDVVPRLEGGRRVARFPFRIRGGEAGSRVTLSGRPSVLTADGGRENDAPVGEEAPAVFAWSCGDQRLADGVGAVEVSVDPSETYALYVTIPESAAVTVAIAVEQEGTQ